MNTEKLKVIAEGMGHKEACIIGGHYFMCGDLNGETYEYNPLTNDTQCMEIMKKLYICIDQMPSEKIYAQVKMDGEWVTGKTINEAVCNAAYEHFK